MHRITDLLISFLQSLYAFWQYEVCDVFIELVKPAVQFKDSGPAAEAEKTAYRETLWLCLDAGLRQAPTYRLQSLSSQTIYCRLMLNQVKVNSETAKQYCSILEPSFTQQELYSGFCGGSDIETSFADLSIQ